MIVLEIIAIVVMPAIVGVFAGCGFVALRQQKRLIDEITELQAAVDILMLDGGHRPWFAQRHDVEFERTDEGEGPVAE